MSRLQGFINGRIFTSVDEDDTLHDAMVIKGDTIEYVGSREGPDNANLQACLRNAIDLQGKVVLPGIIDAHTHLTMMGASMLKLDMINLSAAQIQSRLQTALARDPRATILLGKSFLFDALGRRPHRLILDEVVGEDLPVFIDSADLHSAWLSTGALKAIGVDDLTPDPPGGSFERDEKDRLTGLCLETAVTEFVWPYIASLAHLEDRIRYLRNAFDQYLAVGVTGVVDMAMSEADLAALEELHAREGRLPLRVSAHWLVNNIGTDESRAQSVRLAAHHRDRLRKLDPWLQVVGIKIISDGVVDSCTAYLTKSYANGSMAHPIWPMDALEPVVCLADSLDLQIAVHAIGDAASSQALDAFETAIRVNGSRPARRHRLEHLEVVSPESISRLARLGIVASLQPVHADPVYVPNWRLMLGEDERCDRAFPWTEYGDAQAHVAFGSDAPTAPHHCFPNLYTATTRQSGVNPKLPPSQNPRIEKLDRFCVSLETGIRYYTAGAAFSSRCEQGYGRLKRGMKADFCILSIDPFLEGVQTLREAQEGVKQTWIAGVKVFDRGSPK
ncbi:uncharacterized protein L199_006518 [Kwoniella botswanensis]|uniref:uncharacterized protein n=1 Tax=Kwoniella botswanensis TaxID=1268659 RepID=UPI00315D972E